MRLGWTIVAAALLSACSDSAAAPENTLQDNDKPAPVAAAASPAPANAERTILAFGDSLFAGYRLGRNESYPAKLQAALKARGIDARVTNAGVSGDTTAAGRQRIGFVLGSLTARPELAIVELGGNDLLRGLPPAETRANLEAILSELKKRDVPVLLMGMRAPPNMGAAFVSEFDAIYPALAEKYDARLVPFFLAAIYDKPQLRQQDFVHPTAQGVDALVAATVDDVAKALPPVR